MTQLFTMLFDAGIVLMTSRISESGSGQKTPRSFTIGGRSILLVFVAPERLSTAVVCCRPAGLLCTLRVGGLPISQTDSQDAGAREIGIPSLGSVQLPAIGPISFLFGSGIGLSLGYIPPDDIAEMMNPSRLFMEHVDKGFQPGVFVRGGSPVSMKLWRRFD